MAKVISFQDAKALRSKATVYYTMELQPEDLGLSLTPEQMGVDENGKPNKTIEIKFRPFTREELNDILAEIKDEKGAEFFDEKDFAIVQLCLVEPEIPATADGRRFMESWLPGTLTNVRAQIEEYSGYRRNYLVEKATDGVKATDAIKNSASTPKTTT